MPKPKAIFTDWNGTLSDSHFWGHLKESINKQDRLLYEKWHSAMFTDNKEMLREWMRGGYTAEDMIRFVADKTGDDCNHILSEFIVGCKLMRFCTEDIPELITKLRQNGIIVAIATDNMDCFSRWTVPSMNLESIFDEIINSFNTNTLKLDTDNSGKSCFFTAFFQRHDILPKNCMMLDDSEDRNGNIAKTGISYNQIASSKDLSTILRELTNFN